MNEFILAISLVMFFVVMAYFYYVFGKRKENFDYELPEVVSFPASKIKVIEVDNGWAVEGLTLDKIVFLGKIDDSYCVVYGPKNDKKIVGHVGIGKNGEVMENFKVKKGSRNNEGGVVNTKQHHIIFSVTGESWMNEKKFEKVFVVK